MKALFVLLVFVPLVFGQRSGLRDLIKSHPEYAWNDGKKTISENSVVFTDNFFIMTSQIERSLEKAFSSQLPPRDFISLGIKSIEDNFESTDIIHGLSWRPNGDMTFRLKSKLIYSYNPRQLPKDPFVFLDKVFFQPVRMLAVKTFSF